MNKGPDVAILIPVSEAERLIRERVTAYQAETRPLGEAAGAILREEIIAERDQPPFDRVTMDGIAIDHEAWLREVRSFEVQGTQGAGDPPLRLEAADRCIEIMTGAALPEGCDCIVPVEYVDTASGRAEIAPEYLAERGQYVHERGSDYVRGASLLRPGTRLLAPEIAVAAAAGKSRLQVGRAPAIAIVSTGDELVDIDAPLAPQQIRRSNDSAAAAALRRHGMQATRVEHYPDDRDRLRDGLGELLGTHEVLILSGGVSMGRYDYIPGVLEELSVEIAFHKVSQTPGKPMWFGMGAAGQAVFALPGNPVSTLVCLHRYVLPALERAMGLHDADAERVALAREVEFRRPLTCFMPVKLSYDDSGRAWAEPRPTNTSGDFASLAGTDGFVELEKELELFPAGHVAELFRW